MAVDLRDISSFSPGGATSEILREVDRAVTEINENRPLPASLGKKLQDDLLYDRIYSSAVTEGNRLSRRETIALLTTGVIEAGSRKDVAEIKNLGRAVLRLDEFVQTAVELSAACIRDLHAIVMEGMPKFEPGCFRLEDLAISGASVRPPPAGDVPDLVRRMATMVNSCVDTAHPVVLAAWAHWAIARIHPFRDGNGRVARLVQDFVLLRRNYLPVPLFAEDRERQYYETLEAADLGDPAPLVELMSKNVLRVADRYLAAIHEDEEKREWIDSIARVAKERVRETDHRRFIRWERRVAALRLEFEELADELTNEVPRLSVRVRDYLGVDLEKYRFLVRRRRAERTWLFGPDLKYEQTRLRFVLWAAARHERPSEPTVALDSEPVVLVSMEEQQNAVSPPPKPYYRSLDDLDEGIVTLREILIGDEGFTRRRFNPIERRDEWDEKVSAGQLARDFYEEVMRKLRLV